MENYIEAKANLFRMQLPGSYAVLNAGDPVCRSFAGLTVAQTIWFGRRTFAKAEVWLGQDPLMPLADIPIPGPHNAENVLAAAQVARIAGVPVESIAALYEPLKPWNIDWNSLPLSPVFAITTTPRQPASTRQ